MPEPPTTIFTLTKTLDEIRLLLQAGANDRAAILGALNQQNGKIDQIILTLAAQGAQLTTAQSILGGQIAIVDGKFSGLSDKVDTQIANEAELLNLVLVVIEDIGEALGILNTPVSVSGDPKTIFFVRQPLPGSRVSGNPRTIFTTPQSLPSA